VAAAAAGASRRVTLALGELRHTVGGCTRRYAGSVRGEQCGETGMLSLRRVRLKADSSGDGEQKQVCLIPPRAWVHTRPYTGFVLCHDIDETPYPAVHSLTYTPVVAVAGGAAA
jgi:hypothetical protein